jgi:plastocyanin
LTAAILLAAVVPASAATWTVNVVDYAFEPDYVAIDLNDTVEWLWDFDTVMGYSTTSDPGQLESWDSGIRYAGASFSHAFTHAGTFKYYSTYGGSPGGHGMCGQVQVNPIPEPASLLALTSLTCALGGTILRRRRMR